ncbi:MAG: GntR family transcriptional regulator [Alphaproteobacteria bacterium]|nr:GntR family transcriptional regulator [Alphaproteobacteria bacterium]
MIKNDDISTKDVDKKPSRPSQASDLVGWLVSVIGNDIMNGTLKAGEKISEPRLSRELGVSRGPLREAIRRLEARQLLVCKPNLGARVASFTTEDFIGLFHVREGLEGIAARLAATHIDSSEIKSLRSLCVAHAKHLPDSEKARQVDLEFHFRVAQASGSPVLTNMLCDDFYAVFRICRRQAPRFPGRPEKALRQHMALLDAMTERDADLAEYLARRHVRDARCAFEKALPQQRTVNADGPVATANAPQDYLETRRRQ